MNQGKKVKNNMEKFITAKEAAELISCKVKTVYHYAAKGLLPSVKIAGLRRFRPRDIENFVSRQIYLNR